MISRFSPRFYGAALILAATVISGIASYVVIWLVPKAIGFGAYTEFAIFWATMYLIIGTLSGVQHEIARATRPLVESSVSEVNRAKRFGTVAVAVVGILLPLSGLIWAPVVFPTFGSALIGPLAVGAAGYVTVAVLCGTLYGLSRWGWVAAFTVADAAFRVILVAITLQFTSDVVLIAWAAALPFPLAILAFWPVVRHRVVGRAQLDVGFSALTSNVLHTVGGAASTSVMVSGLPLFIGVTSMTADAAELGMVILAITLVRAPLIVPAMALQSFLVIRLRGGALTKRAIGTIIGALTGIGVALAALGAAIGPWVFESLYPGEPIPSGVFIATLVGSSVLIAALFFTGSAALARSQHRWFVAGWATGAIASISTLVLVPGDLLFRVTLTLVVAPIAGMLVHVIGLRGRRADVGP